VLDEVMPSGHKHAKVCFGRRKLDDTEVVIKLRFKPYCFRRVADERDWRRNTELLMNFPPHESICKLFEVLEDERAIYIIMERIHGMDLFETLEAEGYLEADVACDVLRQLLEATAFLHSHSAVHKDLKLENVMLDKRSSINGTKMPKPVRKVKVIDFDTVEEWSPLSPASKDVVGTDQYIAQEAYAGRYSPASDMFALGVIAYRTLTGRFPFDEKTFDDAPGENWVGSAKMNEIRQKLNTIRVDYSHRAFVNNPKALDIIQKLLSSDETVRPSAREALNHPWFRGDDQLLEIAITNSRSEAVCGDSVDAGALVASEAVMSLAHRRTLFRI